MPNPVLHQTRVLGSVLNSSFGAWRGCVVIQSVPQPAKPFVLYDIEGCPFCRRVREALTALHLDADIRPCPKGGSRFRAEAEQLGGKAQFPFFVDPNTDTQLYESKTIIDYLFRTYTNRSVPRYYRTSSLQPVLGSLGTALSGLRGTRVRSSRRPEQPLHLWSFEGSPYARLVREHLTELEIPYRLHNLGKEHWHELGPAARRIAPNPYVPQAGGKRHAFYQQHGRVQVPYLQDPNTGVALFESSNIIDYVERTYAL